MLRKILRLIAMPWLLVTACRSGRAAKENGINWGRILFLLWQRAVGRNNRGALRRMKAPSDATRYLRVSTAP